MTLQLNALAFDANDPQNLAGFWTPALRWTVANDASDTDTDAVRVTSTDGTRFDVVVRESPGTKREKNRIHIDLTTTTADDQSGTVEHLLALGGRHVDIGQGPDETHVVLADPEGNEFCVIDPDNQFLSTCGRFGSITCDGSPAVGYFWRDALGWQLTWDQDGETAIRAPDGTGPFITWGTPVPATPPTTRLHLEVAPTADRDVPTEVERLVALGAQRVDDSQTGDDGSVLLRDPDGNPFRIVPA